MKKYFLIPILFFSVLVPVAQASVSAELVDGALVLTGTSPTDVIAFFNKQQSVDWGQFYIGTSSVSFRPIDFYPNLPAFPGMMVVAYSSEYVPLGCAIDPLNETTYLLYVGCVSGGAERVNDVTESFNMVDEDTFEVLNYFDPINSISSNGGADGQFSGVSGQWGNTPEQFRLFAPSDTEFLYDVYDTYCEDEYLPGSWEGYTFACDVSSSLESGYWYFDDGSWYVNDNGTGTGFRYYHYDPI